MTEEDYRAQVASNETKPESVDRRIWIKGDALSASPTIYTMTFVFAIAAIIDIVASSVCKDQ